MKGAFVYCSGRSAFKRVNATESTRKTALDLLMRHPAVGVKG
jgi:hypothetical protein